MKISTTFALLSALGGLSCQARGTSTESGHSGTNVESSNATGLSTSSETFASASDQASESPSDACEASDPAEPVTLRVVNQTAATLFLAGGNRCDPPHAISLERMGNTLEWFARACEVTCLEALAGECDGDCDADCQADVSLRLEPGGVYETIWDGMTYLDTVLDCPPPACGMTCMGTNQADGAYEFRASASSSCLPGGGGCNCVPNEEGWCFERPGDVTDGTDAFAVVEFVRPTDDVVELMFQ